MNNKYTTKYLREWAKREGVPMPKHIVIYPLINGAEGVYTVQTFAIRDGYIDRVNYLYALKNAAQRKGYYTENIIADNIGTSIMVDFVGKFGTIQLVQ